MSQKQPRKHHYVQAEHLRQFTNDEGVLFVYGKDESRFHGTPESLFKQKDLNSYETDAGLDTSFEGFVTEVENLTFPAIKRTIENEKIDEADIVAITGYLALSAMRNPSVQAGIIEHRRQLVEVHAKMMDRRGEFADLPSPAELGDKSLEQLIDEGSIKIEINNSVYLEALYEMMQGLHRVLAGGYQWSLVRSGKGRVLISDHPLTIVHPGKNFGLYGIPPGGGEAEAAFPLSKKLYLVGGWKTQFRKSRSKNAVAELNKRQAIHANRHVASCENRHGFQDLALRYRGIGLQTVSNVMDMGSQAFQQISRGIFSLPDAPERKTAFQLGDEVKPLKKLL